MFAKKAPSTATRAKINPTATVLHISEVTELFGIKPGTLRQYVSRGTMPEPTVRRSPELGWAAEDIYAWAHEQRLMPLAAIPFRHLRHVIDHTETRGAPVPRVHSVAGITQGSRQDSGVQVHYGGLTDEGLGFTLYYPGLHGQLRPTPGEVGIIARVTGHLHPRGFYLDVHQTHPDYDYETDTEVFTQDVAELVGEAIPYWPTQLRSAAVGVDRSTGHVTTAEPAVAHPSPWNVTRGRNFESFAASPQGQEHPELVQAMRTAVASDYSRAASDAEHFISKYVRRHQTLAWPLTNPTRHLVLAATVADAPAQNDDEADVHARLEDLAWQEPVGDSPIARQVALDCTRSLNQLMFSMAGATAAQRAFVASLVPVAEGDATLAHLALNPPGGVPSITATLPRTFWRDHYSGAVVTIYEETESHPAYCCYAVPQELPQPVTVKSFDFEDHTTPFMWAVDGAAIPYPEHHEEGYPGSSYTLGYLGSGPIAVMETTARLLDVPPLDHRALPPTWPFYSRGYPTTVPAEEMRAYYAQTEVSHD